MLGIKTRETDLSVSISTKIASTSAAIVFEASWGPVYKIYSTKNEADLIATFQKPKSFQTNYQSCINYAKYSTNIKACRVSTGKNARAVKDLPVRGWLWNSANMILWDSEENYVELADNSADSCTPTYTVFNNV